MSQIVDTDPHTQKQPQAQTQISPESPPTHLSVPSSISLSIPFFSRSSTSTTNTTSSYSYSSSELQTSYSDFSNDNDNDNYDYNDHHRSQHSFNTYLNPNFRLVDPKSQSLHKSFSNTSSIRSIRPELKKMPSWNNQTWSPRSSTEFGTSQRDFIDFQRRQSDESDNSTTSDVRAHDGKDVESNDDGRRRKRTSLIKLDFSTWGRKSKNIFSSPKKNSISISSFKIKSNSIDSRFEKEGQFHSDGSNADDTFNPLQRVWARRDDELIERERRGSDWPPTRTRELTLNLSLTSIPTFIDENNDLTNTTSSEGAEQSSSSEIPFTQRVDTPLEMPFLPKLNLRKSHSSVLSPVLDGEEEVEEETKIDNTEIESNKIKQEEDNSPKPDTEKEEFFTPCFNPSSSFNKSTYPSRLGRSTVNVVSAINKETEIQRNIEESSPIFDCSIFSPRPDSKILPRAPILKALDRNDSPSLPISPLDLPSISSFSSVLFPTLDNTSKISNITETQTEIDTKVGADNSSPSSIIIPTPRRSLPDQSIESILNPSLVQMSLGRKSSLTERRPSSRTSFGLPSTVSTESPSLGVLPRRRMSVIIRPSVLPCPTPPSLLTSPKTLGNEYLPSFNSNVPLFSPCSISPTQSIFNSQTSSLALGGSISGLPIRRGRGSLKMKLPPSYLGNSNGLGLGSEKNDQEPEKEEHIPTPGTFGLESEKDKMDQVEVNPYFA
ncbi:uncharacterized protein L201_006052 [Kwoniella dendrophila CBS 6074]|uniref:Uncharacterized protein n=1 Tax=Kwoniella dendrophila CBS 6074 TaxID=1295534 RepID=A0AAX4K050_9TREE